MNMDDILVKASSNMQDGFASLGPQAITRAVLDTLEQQETVSIKDVITTMQGWLNDIPTEKEPLRITITSGIDHLESLQERHQSA
jgi:hypothetical protein